MSHPSPEPQTSSSIGLLVGITAALITMLGAIAGFAAKPTAALMIVVLALLIGLLVLVVRAVEHLAGEGEQPDDAPVAPVPPAAAAPRRTRRRLHLPAVLHH